MHAVSDLAVQAELLHRYTGIITAITVVITPTMLQPQTMSPLCAVAIMTIVTEMPMFVE